MYRTQNQNSSNLSCSNSSPYTKINRTSILEPQTANKENQYLKSLQAQSNGFYKNNPLQVYTDENTMAAIGHTSEMLSPKSSYKNLDYYQDQRMMQMQ